MSLSIFDLFSIGIGPSSSHTVGPMRAARKFAAMLKEKQLPEEVEKIEVSLYGSLALTGKGHGSDRAILMGLEGHTPQEVDPAEFHQRPLVIYREGKLHLFGESPIAFSLQFLTDKTLSYHPNGIHFAALGRGDRVLYANTYYSIGGGFILDQAAATKNHPPHETFPFRTCQELLELCQNKSIAEVVRQHELRFRSHSDIEAGLLHIWDVMNGCIEKGCRGEGILPGGLNVERRAGPLYAHLQRENTHRGPLSVMKWVSLWALAVGEENASAHRVVTAPTNGAAGIIPATLRFYQEFTEGANNKGIIDFLLTAGAIGMLYKMEASIAAAEMGCMGEVGVACSMAAAGLTAAMGGTVAQIENGAEIGMEHNLGLTCDPVMGLVQIPCIERNAMGAVKAINAAILALEGTGKHRVSLDQVIATMRQTGLDMQSIYKETSMGGLAVNVPEC